MTLREASTEAMRRCGIPEAEIIRTANFANLVVKNCAALFFVQIRSGHEESVISRFVNLQTCGTMLNVKDILENHCVPVEYN